MSVDQKTSLVQRNAMADRSLGVALAVLSASGFATLGLFAKLVFAQGLSVPQALSWRFTVAALAIWIYLLASGTLKTRARGTIPLALLGLFGFAPQAGLYFLTVQILDPGISSLLLYLYPSFVVILSLLFLRKKPTKIQLAALALSLCGCALTFWKSGRYPLLGLAIGVFMAFAYGCYLVAGEKVLADKDPVYATAVIMAVAAATYWTIALATDGFAWPSGIASISGIAGMAFVSTILAVITLFASIKILGASDSSLISTVEPVLTVALSALIIGERMGIAQLAGGLFIVAAVVVMNVKTRESGSGKTANKRE